MKYEAFSAAVDDSTHATIEAFRARGAELPSDMDSLGNLMVRINDALSEAMAAYLGE